MSAAPATSTASEPWQLALYRRGLKKRLTVKAVLANLPDPAGRHCLEIGCATGITSHFLRQRGGTWVSGDFDADQTRSAAEIVDRVVHLGPAGLPFADASFDVVAGINFLEHLRDDAHWVREMRRVLRPGGELLFIAPSGETHRPGFAVKKWFGLTAARSGLGHVRDGYPPDAARRLFESNGWTVTHVGDYCRFFSETLEDLLNGLFQRRTAARGGAARDFHGNTAPTSSASLRKVGAAYRVYGMMLPLLRAWAALDGLLVGSRGYMIILRATRPAV